VKRLRRTGRRLGTTMIVAGLIVIAYAAAVVFWRDPVTDVYTAYQQHELSSSLNHESHLWAQRAETSVARHRETNVVEQVAAVRTVAAEFARAHRGHNGQALGRIVIGRLGLSEVFVEGTDYWDSLTRGPGRYTQTSYPGLGHTIAIAGHRTTWSAPFRHIDSLRVGDAITLRMPYATFTYRVTSHRIVRNDDWSIIKDVGYEQLVLSACHPLYSASHRYVIFARLAKLTPAGQRHAIAAT
jgi:sortase A